ncbi:class I SAM-dependent methyltransferase [Kytococcus sedentarius]|uniref:class I SAM-dependent methyltransferase n=1 Tax=Kytococcus sedentarius TaxID=1276 RepID=UPI0035BC8567
MRAGLWGSARGGLGSRASHALRALNDRHPWSHNDAFHSWVLSRLPARRGLALDVGCGRGELLARLADHFERAHGIDADEDMRRASERRCAGLPHVTVGAGPLEDHPPGVDLVTMVAVLHHLDLEHALQEVRRVLNPGGRFLCVGLARPASPVDHAWEVASMVTNPLIGMVRHPWVARMPPGPDPFPTKEPELTLGEIQTAAQEALPGVVVRRHLGFRHTLEWTKPLPRR